MPQVPKGFCEVCGQELRVEEKLRGLKRHEGECPTPRESASASATMPNHRRYHRTDPVVEVEPSEVSSTYAGASMVATTLSIIGWLIAIVGIVVGAAAATSANCEDFFDTYKCSGGQEAGLRLGILVGSIITSWLLATSVLWAAYVLRLLSDIEAHQREE